MGERQVMPGTQVIARSVLAVLPGPVPGQAWCSARLRDRAGRVVHTLTRPLPVGTRVLMWRGRVFLHWEGREWRETAVAVVEETGQ